MRLLAGRVWRGAGKAANWAQLVKFAAVGLSGYVVNLIVFALLRAGGASLSLAAAGAFAIALGNNFLWNRHWTFSGSKRWRKRHQAPRFLIVSVAGFGINLGVLHALVGLGLGDISAQALAIGSATPFNFVANKVWTFDATVASGARRRRAELGPRLGPEAGE